MYRFSKQVFLYIAFAAFLINLFSCEKSEVELSETEKSPFNSFHDVPGITQEEIEAIEVLQKRGLPFVYGALETTEAFYDQNNNIRGFAAIFCDRLTALFGIQFKPVIFEWDDLITGLETGQIDFTGELSLNRERQKEYFMSETIAVRPIKYMRLKGLPLSEIAKERTVRLAFLDGSTVSNRVLTADVFEIFESFFVKDTAAAYKLLKSNKVDAFVEKGVFEAAFDIYGEVISENFFPMTFDFVSMSTQKAELEPIISVCKKIYKTEHGRLLALLYNEGYREYLKHKLFLKLTDAEKAFLKEYPVIKFGAEFDNYPVCFFSSSENKLQGIAIDVLNEITELTGIMFEPANNNKTERANIYKTLENGEISFVTELFQSKDRQENFIWSQSILMKDRYALVSKEEYRNIDIKEIIFFKIGLTKNTADTEYFNSVFPNHNNTIMYETLDMAINAMDRGEIDMVMSTNHQFLMLTNYHELSGYKVNLLFDDSHDVMFGFNKNEGLLRSIIDKALAFIDADVISGQWLRRNFDYRIKLLQMRFIGIVTASALMLALLIISILFYKKRIESRVLESLVQKRTAELEAARDEAKAASLAKSSFLVSMSHEIRTPMNSIIGFAELAQDGEKLPKTKDYLSKIQANGEWLLQIINNILDISKIESGRLEFEKIPFSFDELFAGCQTLVLPKAIKKGLTLIFSVEPVLNKKPLGDPTKLRQVFVNLLSNAIKFTETGVVKLNSKITNQTDNSITLHFEVIDSGIGMTEEQIKKIFKPFTQAELEITRKYGGSGLGLTISKNIVEKMGGILSVESRVGLGSKFSFQLTFETVDTVEENSQKRENEFQELEKPDLEGEVLLCEDNEMNQLVIVKHFERVGLKAVIAENGKIGVEMVQKRKESGEKQFDLIFMDMFMPVMNGLEAAIEIKKIDREIPIVAMTANVLESDLKVYKETGLSDFVGKPFSSQELWRCLLKYFTPKK